MGRKERRSPRVERIRMALEAGDHAAARAAARALANDAGASEDERGEAAALLASLGPDPGALVAGALGVAGALAVTVLLLVRG